MDLDITGQGPVFGVAVRVPVMAPPLGMSRITHCVSERVMVVLEVDREEGGPAEVVRDVQV